jgi:hypothetical protein
MVLVPLTFGLLAIFCKMYYINYLYQKEKSSFYKKKIDELREYCRGVITPQDQFKIEEVFKSIDDFNK